MLDYTLGSSMLFHSRVTLQLSVIHTSKKSLTTFVQTDTSNHSLRISSRALFVKKILEQQQWRLELGWAH